MSKQGEINYLKNLSQRGVIHAINKPFSDRLCGEMLSEIGGIMSLLPPPPAKLLDLGCGTGWTSIFFAKRGYNVVGMDISKDKIKYANINKKKANLKNLDFIVSDYEEISFESNFDCVVFFDSLHHSMSTRKAMQSAYKTLKSGGVIVISEPGSGHSKASRSIEAVKKYGVTEKDILPRKIVKIGKQIGFKAHKIYPHSSHLTFILYCRNLNKISGKSFIKKSFKFSFFRILSTIFLIIFYKNYNGIVLMVK